jgi:indole-3-glycerol phosphate synthase
MTILDKIVEAKKSRLEHIQLGNYEIKDIKENRFYKILAEDEFSVIYEFKRKTPSSGILNENVNILEQIKKYVDMGAKIVSILTEEDFFSGSYDDIKLVKDFYPELIILNKDFIIDEIQIKKAAELNVDAILLIGQILTLERLEALKSYAELLGLSILYEAYTKEDIKKANKLKFPVVGINNRNLANFDIDLNHSRKLSTLLDYSPAIISESGMDSQEDINSVKDHAKGALVGSAFMRGLNYAV